MADFGIKNVIIEKSNLPEVYGVHQEYLVRYRIVSDDKNRLSHWSPQYKLAVSNQSNINYSLSIDNPSNVIRLVWEPVLNISQYDLYAKWDNQSWEYVSAVSSTSYSLLIKDNTSSVKFAVQIPTFPKNRFNGLTLFETESATV
jgi:hypothetical protein